MDRPEAYSGEARSYFEMISKSVQYKEADETEVAINYSFQSIIFIHFPFHSLQ